MEFKLSRECLAIQKEARLFARREITPYVRDDVFKRELVEKMGEMGFFGCAFPSRFGGSKLGFLVHSVVCEEISRADSGLRSLFNLQAMIEASRLLVKQASWLNDQDQPFTREVAIAKYFAGETAVKASGMAMEIFGGMRYSLDAPVERLYRNAKIYQVGEETANIMRLLIGDDALGLKKANRPRLHIPSDHL